MDTQCCEQNACKQKMCKESGNAVVLILVLLVIVAVGALAFMSGKMGSVQQNAGQEKVASADSSATPGEQAKDDPAAEDPVVAKVDGEDVKRSEVVALVNIMPPQMQQIPMEQLLPIAIEQLISNKIIDKKVIGSNLENDAEVKKQLENAKTQIIRAKFVENEVTKLITEEKLKTKYEEYVKSFKDVEEMKAAHILVKDEAKAKEIIKKLDDGAVFADLAKENSTDATAKNGGDLGYFTKQDVVPEFANAAFATDVGKYTKKPVKSDFGYHVIKVEDKRKRPPAEFDKAKPYLEQEIRREILDEVVMKWREDAKIERFDLNGKPLPEKQEPAAGEKPAAEQVAPAAAEESKKPEDAAAAKPAQ